VYWSLGKYHDETLALYSEYGGLLRHLGRYEQALNALYKALHIAKTTKGVHHLDYAAALVNLANLSSKCIGSQRLFLFI